MEDRENNLLLDDDVCLFGFSGSYLSLIFNSLRDCGYKKAIKIIKNIEVTDNVPFNCGLDYSIYKSGEYERRSKDKFLFSVSTPWIKEKIFSHFLESHDISKDQYFNLIHPSSDVATTVSLSTGIYVEPGCVISPYADLGFGLSMNRSVSVGHHTQIGDFTTIYPGAHIAGHCKLGRKVKVGMGSVVFDRIEIGANTIIGGGSVVTKNVPSGVVAYGNPCKVIKEL